MMLSSKREWYFLHHALAPRKQRANFIIQLVASELVTCDQPICIWSNKPPMKLIKISPCAQPPLSITKLVHFTLSHEYLSSWYWICSLNSDRREPDGIEQSGLDGKRHCSTVTAWVARSARGSRAYPTARLESRGGDLAARDVAAATMSENSTGRSSLATRSLGVQESNRAQAGTQGLGACGCGCEDCALVPSGLLRFILRSCLYEMVFVMLSTAHPLNSLRISRRHPPSLMVRPQETPSMVRVVAIAGFDVQLCQGAYTLAGARVRFQ
ncbi:hypothetical protein JHW43_000404 [Diplocarpon mali]|nr:hypothetical protein JHW43_000404 [Diplocarpon mali]